MLSCRVKSSEREENWYARRKEETCDIARAVSEDPQLGWHGEGLPKRFGLDRDMNISGRTPVQVETGITHL
jgi:hypothetical protein